MFPVEIANPREVEIDCLFNVILRPQPQSRPHMLNGHTTENSMCSHTLVLNGLPVSTLGADTGQRLYHAQPALSAQYDCFRTTPLSVLGVDCNSDRAPLSLVPCP